MANYTQDSVNNDTTHQDPTFSQAHGLESNNIRPPHGVFSCDVLAYGHDYLDGYPLERLNDSNTTYLGQRRQVNFRLDTTKYVVPLAERVCPHCEAKGKLHRHETKEAVLTTLPYDDLPTKITVIRQWFRCQECGRLCVDAIPGRFEHTFMTRKLAEAIFDRLSSGCKSSMRDLAIHFRISEKRVASLVDYAAEHGSRAFAQACISLKRFRKSSEQEIQCNFTPPQRIIKKLAIDEVALKGREYITIFLDLEISEVLYFAEGHGYSAIDKFVDWAGDMLADDVMVATDMNAAFIEALRVHRPNIVPMYDRFHFERKSAEHLVEMILLVARKLKEEGRAEDAKLLRDYGSQCLILTTKPETLEPDAQELRNKLLGLHPMLAKIQEAFYSQHMGFECRDLELADQYFNKTISLCVKLQQWAVDSFKTFKLKPDLADYGEEPAEKEESTPPNYALAPAQKILSAEERKNLRFCGAGTLGSHIIKHKDKFLNYAKLGLTTGPLEGLNNVFKSLKRVVYGIKRVDRFMYRIVIISRAPYHRSV